MPLDRVEVRLDSDIRESRWCEWLSIRESLRLNGGSFGRVTRSFKKYLKRGGQVDSTNPGLLLRPVTLDTSMSYSTDGTVGHCLFRYSLEEGEDLHALWFGL